MFPQFLSIVSAARNPQVTFIEKHQLKVTTILKLINNDDENVSNSIQKQ